MNYFGAVLISKRSVGLAHVNSTHGQAQTNTTLNRLNLDLGPNLTAGTATLPLEGFVDPLTRRNNALLTSVRRRVAMARGGDYMSEALGLHSRSQVCNALGAIRYRI